MTAASDALALRNKVLTPTNAVTLTKAQLAAALADTSMLPANAGVAHLAAIVQMLRNCEIRPTDR